ncbi:MAG: outer membrane beta-barrel protein [Alphaproteobacteria bacterium]|nr:outer membrane beta-barrel protein [Alphaproteobacteria bacterium]
MKKLFVFAVAMIASTPALAEGLYVGGFIGPAAVGSSDLRAPAGGGTVGIEFDTGLKAGMMLGTRVGDHVRIEGEFAFGSVPVASINSTAVDGNVETLFLGANVIYDFSGDRFIPHLGAGLGVINIDASDVNDGGAPVFEGGTVTGALQLIAGVDIPVGSVVLFADYRGMVTPYFDLHQVSTGDPYTMLNGFMTNSVMFGVKASF